jgi:hypothetical protein
MKMEEIPARPLMEEGNSKFSHLPVSLLYAIQLKLSFPQ